MNYKIIMTEKPVLFSDENINTLDWIIHFLPNNKIGIGKITSLGMKDYHKYKNNWFKIIAGLPDLPELDLSLVADEIGWVDVEKLAEEKYPIQIGGSAWMPTTHDCIQANKQEGFIEGFKAAQFLNKNNWSDIDMIDFQKFILGHSNKNLKMYRYLVDFKDSKKPNEYSVGFIKQDNKIKITEIFK